MSLGILITPTM